MRQERQLRARRRAQYQRGVSGFSGLLLVALLALGTVGGAFTAGAILFTRATAEVESPEALLSELSRGGARVYDRHGTLMYEFVDRREGLRRPVPLEQISQDVINATIAVEDPSFYDNAGINVRGLSRAAYENFLPADGGELLQGSGGSSITQQLAKNVYIPEEERTERSISRKLRETIIALELTRRYEKDQILEWYLNTIPYGSIYVGIEAAAEGYFGKHASDLTLAEAALLAGLPQAPSRYDPIQNIEAARDRQRQVLDLMVERRMITPAEADRAATESLAFRKRQFTIAAPHFVLGRVADEIKARFGERALYDDGLEVVTTLDLEMQRMAEEVVEEHVAKHEAATNTHNGALYALDPKTGEVLVYVGSRDYFDESIYGNNDNIAALNSPGSTLKPFTYMTAFKRGWSTGTPIPDVPTRYHDPVNGQIFEPTNPGKTYTGLITAAEALGNSLNVPALRAILFAGVEETVETLRNVGYTTFDNRALYGPALTLGGTDIKLEESVFAYSVLANGGVMRGVAPARPHDEGERQVDPVILRRVTNSLGEVLYEFEEPAEERVVDEALAYMVTSILADGRNTAITWGVPDRLKLGNGMPSAVKTGTSEPFPDSEDVGETWTIGFTSELVAGIWAGNTNNARIHNIFSTTIAWNAWNDFMVKAHELRGLEGREFERPPGVQDATLCWPTGALASSGCFGRQYAGLILEGTTPPPRWWLNSDQRAISLDVNSATAAALAGYNMQPENDSAGQQSGSAAQTTTDEGPANQPSGSTALAISSPGAGGTVNGSVAITGTATSGSFEGFVVDVIANGQSIPLNVSRAPVSGGVLAVWNTAGVPNGSYIVRVVLRDGQRGTMQTAIPVTVAN